ncbi:MAG: hypothetical protein MJ124_06655 [Lachnospiraceae bacterium]|nr:hypothetical protein [Lachnospiraceae bacterium]
MIKVKKQFETEYNKQVSAFYNGGNSGKYEFENAMKAAEAAVPERSEEQRVTSEVAKGRTMIQGKPLLILPVGEEKKAEVTDDWREMPDDAWEKMLKDFDEYFDTVRENLDKRSELQREAAAKAAALAPADKKSIAAAVAALKVAATGIMPTFNSEEEDSRE